MGAIACAVKVDVRILTLSPISDARLQLVGSAPL